MDSLSLVGSPLLGVLDQTVSASRTPIGGATQGELRRDLASVQADLSWGLRSRDASIKQSLSLWNAGARALQGASRFAGEAEAGVASARRAVDDLSKLTRQINATDDAGLKRVLQSSADRLVQHVNETLSPARHGTPSAYGGAVAFSTDGGSSNVAITLPSAQSVGQSEDFALGLPLTADALGSTSGHGSLAALARSEDGSAPDLTNAESILTAAREELAASADALAELRQGLEAYDRGLERTLGTAIGAEQSFQALTLDTLLTTLDLLTGAKQPAAEGFELLAAQNGSLTPGGLASLLG